jgi:cell division protein FtsI/penicillin-binding protein 2
MNKVDRTRIIVASAVASAIFTAFSARLVHIHITKHEEYSRIAADKHSKRQIIRAKRGMILDRNGEILAANLPVRTIFADASHITNPQELATLAASRLSLDAAELAEKFASGKKYIVLKRQVPEQLTLDLFEEMQSRRLRGLYSEKDSIRTYPNGSMLGHVIGFLNHERKGIQGIERTFDAELTGTDGYRYIERDRTGREIVPYRGLEEEPENGQNIRLTIDMHLQAILEEELDATYKELRPETVTAILVDPHTGGILAMGSRPTFDPNNPGEAKPEQMKNRAIIDMVEPGSTFKIVVAAGALNEGTVDEKTSIFCENGRFVYAGRTLRDHHGYAQMSVRDILVKSSNIGSAKMALMMGADKYYEYVRRFGFGERLGIELPGEIAGLVHPPSRWDKLTITRMPMGHAVAVTPLQIAMSMSVIANGGKLMSPRIVQSLESPQGREKTMKAPLVIRNVVPEKTARFVGNALSAVTQPGGTATYARVTGFNVAGKTGTAQKVSPNGGYAAGKYVVSFSGFMPAEDPRFVCLVIVDDAKVASNLNYGGTLAAPVFSRIAEKTARYMNLTPTLPAIPLLDSPLAKIENATQKTH